jgi:hypothetical protein
MENIEKDVKSIYIGFDWSVRREPTQPGHVDVILFCRLTRVDEPDTFIHITK